MYFPSIAEKCKNFVVIYLVDIANVPDFNKMYELYDPCTTMFFFRCACRINLFCILYFLFSILSPGTSTS